MLKFKEWVDSSTKQLSAAGIKSARLDAELILCYTIRKNRTFIHAHPEQIISTRQYVLLKRKLIKRLKRLPVAYITGHKEFFGNNFFVNRNVLIPRPESEDIINILKMLKINKQKISLLDVGTGSGVLGITAKLQIPVLEVTLVDISKLALKVARRNAQKLNAKVQIIKSDLLEKIKEPTDIIVANLPYVDKSWPVSPETAFEPSSALFAEDKGTDLIKKLIAASIKLISNNGILILEADPKQHAEIIEYAEKFCFKLIKKQGFVIALRQC